MLTPPLHRLFLVESDALIGDFPLRREDETARVVYNRLHGKLLHNLLRFEYAREKMEQMSDASLEVIERELAKQGEGRLLAVNHYHLLHIHQKAVAPGDSPAAIALLVSGLPHEESAKEEENSIEKEECVVREDVKNAQIVRWHLKPFRFENEISTLAETILSAEEGMTCGFCSFGFQL